MEKSIAKLLEVTVFLGTLSETIVFLILQDNKETIMTMYIQSRTENGIVYIMPKTTSILLPTMISIIN